MRLLPLCLLLAACSGGDRQPPPPAQAWEIGPTIDGKQYSTGSVNGNVFQIQDIHYITRATGPLAGSVSVSFNLSAKLTGTGCGVTPATATLYFQRAGDDWSMDKGYRWWATFAAATLDHPGDYTIMAPLDGPWTSDQNKNTLNAPQDFEAAKQGAERVGITLGNCTGYGHGATGPATMIIKNFEVTN